jgi:ferredoxin
MLIWIDREGCLRCESCREACGAVFEENPEDSWTQVSGEYRDRGSAGAGDVPCEFEELAVHAAAACPVGVIYASG